MEIVDSAGIPTSSASLCSGARLQPPMSFRSWANLTNRSYAGLPGAWLDSRPKYLEIRAEGRISGSFSDKNKYPFTNVVLSTGDD